MKTIYFNVKSFIIIIIIIEDSLSFNTQIPSSCDRNTLSIIIINQQSLDAFDGNNRHRYRESHVKEQRNNWKIIYPNVRSDKHDFKLDVTLLTMGLMFFCI